MCTAHNHFFTNVGILAIFRDKGVNCTTAFDTDTYTSTCANNPAYSSGICYGWKDIPHQINCGSAPCYASIKRLCPCYKG